MQKEMKIASTLMHCKFQLMKQDTAMGNWLKELRDIIDAAKQNKEKIAFSQQPLPIVQPKGELANLFSASYPRIRLLEMILDDDVSDRLNRIIKEQPQIEKLHSHGLSPRRKFLLLGPPGTGKTMAASALVGELNLPLFVIRLEGVITKFMGETSAKLRLVFDEIKQHRGIYLFDEFDSIGTTRSSINDVGEIRRIGQLGPTLRHKGSIHSDRWQGAAVELAQRSYIGVYPASDWWKERHQLERWNREARYSMIVSITTPKDVKFYKKKICT
jgi:hypothetical protein